MPHRLLLTVLVCALAGCSRRSTSADQQKLTAPSASPSPAPAPLPAASPPTSITNAMSEAVPPVDDGGTAATGTVDATKPREEDAGSGTEVAFEDVEPVVADQRDVPADQIGWDGPLLVMQGTRMVMLDTACVEEDPIRETPAKLPANWEEDHASLGVSTDETLSVVTEAGVKPATIHALSCSTRGECNDGPKVLLTLEYHYIPGTTPVAPPGPPRSAIAAARDGVVSRQARIVPGTNAGEDTGCKPRPAVKAGIEEAACWRVHAPSSPGVEVEVFAARIHKPNGCTQWRTFARIRRDKGPPSPWRHILRSNGGPEVWSVSAADVPDRLPIGALYGCSGGGRVLRMVRIDEKAGLSVGREYVAGGANCD